MVQPTATGWIDVSVTVRHGMPHWPDNPPITLVRVMDQGRGDEFNVSHLAMGVHSGTHMDAPVHFIHQSAGLDEMPLAILRPIPGSSRGSAARSGALR